MPVTICAAIRVGSVRTTVPPFDEEVVEAVRRDEREERGADARRAGACGGPPRARASSRSSPISAAERGREREPQEHLGPGERRDAQARAAATASSCAARRSARCPLAGEVEQLVEPSRARTGALGGRLHLDEAAVAGHDDVHVDVGASSPRSSRGRAAARRRRCRPRPPPTESVSAFERPKRSSARARRDVRAGDRGAARAAVGLEDVAVEPERPLAERLEVDDARAARGRSAAGSRPCAPAACRALASRVVRSPVEAGSSEYSAVIQPLALAAEPARHALLDRSRCRAPRLPLRESTEPCGCSR